MPITIPDLPDVVYKTSVLATQSERLHRFVERVQIEVGENPLIELTPQQKQGLLQKYTEFRIAAQAAAADLME